MFIELVTGFFFDPVTQTIIRDTDEDRCALFRRGDSAVDGGFTLPCEAAKAAEVLDDEEMGEGEPEE